MICFGKPINNSQITILSAISTFLCEETTGTKQKIQRQIYPWPENKCNYAPHTSHQFAKFGEDIPRPCLDLPILDTAVDRSNIREMLYFSE